MVVYKKGKRQARSRSKIVLFRLTCGSCGCRFGVETGDNWHTIREETNSQEGDGLYSVCCPNCERGVEFS